jgi:hypothetical protein
VVLGRTGSAWPHLLDIVSRGPGIAAFLPEVAVMLGFALVFYVFGFLRFRYE